MARPHRYVGVIMGAGAMIAAALAACGTVPGGVDSGAPPGTAPPSKAQQVVDFVQGACAYKTVVSEVATLVNAEAGSSVAAIGNLICGGFQSLKARRMLGPNPAGTVAVSIKGITIRGTPLASRGSSG